MEILIFILATYAVTLLLTEIDGPFSIFYRFRKVRWLTALHCFVCTSVYVGALIAILPASTILEWLVYTFGFSGGAIAVYKIGESWRTN